MTSGVPEPSTWAMLGLGFGLIATGRTIRPVGVLPGWPPFAFLAAEMSSGATMR
jgi:hypothetical protein